MKLSELTIGQKIQGPSGAVYVVLAIFGWKPYEALLGTEDVRTVNLSFDQKMEFCTGRIKVDQVALDRFVPLEPKE